MARVEGREVGVGPGWMANNSLAWECYLHLVKRKGGEGVPRKGKSRGQPVKFTWEPGGNPDGDFKPSKAEVEWEHKLSKVWLSASRVAGSCRSTDRWFDGFAQPGGEEPTQRLPGGGGLWKEHIMSVKRLWNADERFRDASVVRERFRELIGCGCSGVEWAWSEYRQFESQVGGQEWMERMEQEVEPRYAHSKSVWQERVLGGMDYETLGTEEDDEEKVSGVLEGFEVLQPSVSNSLLPSYALVPARGGQRQDQGVAQGRRVRDVQPGAYQRLRNCQAPCPRRLRGGREGLVQVPGGLGGMGCLGEHAGGQVKRRGKPLEDIRHGEVCPPDKRVVDSGMG